MGILGNDSLTGIIANKHMRQISILFLIISFSIQGYSQCPDAKAKEVQNKANNADVNDGQVYAFAQQYYLQKCICLSGQLPDKKTADDYVEQVNAIAKKHNQLGEATHKGKQPTGVLKTISKCNYGEGGQGGSAEDVYVPGTASKINDATYATAEILSYVDNETLNDMFEKLNNNQMLFDQLNTLSSDPADLELMDNMELAANALVVTDGAITLINEIKAAKQEERIKQQAFYDTYGSYKSSLEKAEAQIDAIFLKANNINSLDEIDLRSFENVRQLQNFIRFKNKKLARLRMVVLSYPASDYDIELTKSAWKSSNFFENKATVDNVNDLYASLDQKSKVRFASTKNNSIYKYVHDKEYLFNYYSYCLDYEAIMYENKANNDLEGLAVDVTLYFINNYRMSELVDITLKDEIISDQMRVIFFQILKYPFRHISSTNYDLKRNTFQKTYRKTEVDHKEYIEALCLLLSSQDIRSQVQEIKWMDTINSLFLDYTKDQESFDRSNELIRDEIKRLKRELSN